MTGSVSFGWGLCWWSSCHACHIIFYWFLSCYDCPTLQCCFCVCLYFFLRNFLSLKQKLAHLKSLSQKPIVRLNYFLWMLLVSLRLQLVLVKFHRCFARITASLLLLCTSIFFKWLLPNEDFHGRYRRICLHLLRWSVAHFFHHHHLVWQEQATIKFIRRHPLHFSVTLHLYAVQLLY